MNFTIGGIKISPNGEKFMDFMNADDFFGDFDNATGTMTKISNPIIPNSFLEIGGEFSNDSRYFYYCGALAGIDYVIYQYDATAIDSLTFLNSQIQVGAVHQTPGTNQGQFMWMQAAPDGKIYGVRYAQNTLFTINNPDVEGTGCDFQYDGFDLAGTAGRSLPQFVSSYLQHIYYTGTCVGTTFQFTANFQPAPLSITWDFGDGGTSTLMNPTHVYTSPGTYEVVAYVIYPDGKTGEAHREVLVAGLPHPNLGPDQTVCKGTSVQLNPGSFASYTWNTGATGNTLSVTDTGQYWVQVVNDTGCISRDTLNLSWFRQPVLDETNLIISPTTCGGNTGAIRGLAVLGDPPLSYQWKDASGAVLGDSLNLFGLSVNNYYLWLTDGNSCSTLLKSYSIADAGNLLINTVSFTNADCNNNNGSITVTATSGLSDMLLYSIDNGGTWDLNLGNFPGLPGSTYFVRVRDTSGCEAVYINNPVVIPKLGSPVVNSVTSTPETGSNADGTITVSATGIGLVYSLNGSTPQAAGTFSGLTAGTYSINITNSSGCDTTISAVVGNLAVIRLQAIAGDGSACLGNVAVLPLLANHFNHVGSFSTHLLYDKSLVTCRNYLNANPALADSLKIDLYPTLGELNLEWLGKKPVSLPDGSTLLELSFASVNPGQGQLKWDLSPGLCIFLDSLGTSLPSEFTPGLVRVYSIPEADLEPSAAVCEGSGLLITPLYRPNSGNGTITYAWLGPAGFIGNNPILNIPSTTQGNTGTYFLSLSDTNHCHNNYSVTLNVVPLPVSGFLTDTVYFDGQTRLEAAEGYFQYAWNSGDSTSSILVNSEGWYKVTMKTPEGCTATDSVMMLYSFVPLNMPNAFTPNGDGKNEEFRPVTLPEKISSFSMLIYNRWGQLVFSTNDVGRGWDGRVNGSPAPMGVYTYTLTYGNPKGENRKKTGVVTLVR